MLMQVFHQREPLAALGAGEGAQGRVLPGAPLPRAGGRAVLQPRMRPQRPLRQRLETHDTINATETVFTLTRGYGSKRTVNSQPCSTHSTLPLEGADVVSSSSGVSPTSSGSPTPSSGGVPAASNAVEMMARTSCAASESDCHLTLFSRVRVRFI